MVLFFPRGSNGTTFLSKSQSDAIRKPGVQPLEYVPNDIVNGRAVALGNRRSAVMNVTGALGCLWNNVIAPRFTDADWELPPGVCTPVYPIAQLCR
jgi:hypothetical protein